MLCRTANAYSWHTSCPHMPVWSKYSCARVLRSAVMDTAGNIRQPMIQVRRFLLLLFSSVLSVLAQKPVISPKAVVNAASLAGADQPGWAIAPGSIVSIFGENLARTTRSADSVPLPRELEGTSVSVAGL